MTHPLTEPPPPNGASATAAVATHPAFTDSELRSALRRPAEVLDLVLSRRQRLAASIAEGNNPWLLAALLAVCSVIASVPFGIVRGVGAWWKVAALFGGTALLCFPSLHVFGAFLGGRLRPARNLAFALVIPGVAALFTLGFFPIAWFLAVTMQAGDVIDADKAATAMLAAALLAGLAHVSRCAAQHRSLLANGSWPLLFAWQCLVVFVAFRLARALALFG